IPNPLAVLARSRTFSSARSALVSERITSNISFWKSIRTRAQSSAFQTLKSLFMLSPFQRVVSSVCGVVNGRFRSHLCHAEWSQGAAPGDDVVKKRDDETFLRSA